MREFKIGDPRPDYLLRICIFGATGVKKTLFAQDAPSPTLYLDWDAGTLVLTRPDVRVVQVEGGTSGKIARAWLEGQKALNAALKSDASTIVYDSATRRGEHALQKVLLDNPSAGGRIGPQHWGAQQGLLLEELDRLLQSDKHVIYVIHENFKEVRNMANEVIYAKIQPLLTGALALRIGHAFDELYRFVAGPKGNIKVYTGHDYDGETLFRAKSRLNLPHLLAWQDLWPEIHKALARKAKENDAPRKVSA